MMIRSIKTVCLFVVLFVCSVSGYSQNDYQVEKDSLLNVIPGLEGEEKLLAMRQVCQLLNLMGEPDLLFEHNKEYVEESRRQKNTKHEGRGMLDELFNYYNYGLLDKYLEKASSYMEYFEEIGDYLLYYRAYQVLAEVYVYKGEIEKATEEARKMYEKARTDDNHFGIDTSTYLLGYIHFMKHDYPVAKQFYVETIELQHSRDPKDWSCLFDAYIDILALYPAAVDDREAVELLGGYRKSIGIFEQKVLKAKDDARRRSYYLACMGIYSDMGSIEKAELYSDSLEFSLPENNIMWGDLYLNKGRIAELKKDYAAAYDCYTRGYEIRSAIGNDVLGARLSQIRTLYKLNREDDAYSLTIDMLAERDSVFNIQSKAQLNELHTIYEVDKKNFEIERQRLWLLVASVAIIALVVFLLIRVRYMKNLKAKNIGLVKRIQEQDRLTSKLKAEHAEMERLRQAFKSDVEEPRESEEDILFKQLTALMDEKKPYTDSGLNRKAISEMLGTNEKYVREAIKKNMDITVNEYITQYRLRYAKDLLLKPQEEYTIEAIAIDSGFGSRSTFHALFRNHYGLTPDEFRKFSVQQTGD